MKKIILALLVTMMLVGTAWAKPIDLEIGYTIEEEFIPYISSYKLYTEVPDSGEFVHVATLDPNLANYHVLTALDLDPGKTTNFYLAAVYEGGVEDRSDAFPFKYTGKPIIIKIIRNQ